MSQFNKLYTNKSGCVLMFNGSKIDESIKAYLIGEGYNFCSLDKNSGEIWSDWGLVVAEYFSGNDTYLVITNDEQLLGLL